MTNLTFDIQDDKDQYVHVGAGLVVYVAFLKGATEEAFERIGA